MEGDSERNKAMRLDGDTARDILIIRMKAWTYENVRCGVMREAEKFADQALAGFDAMMTANPADHAGYWSVFYFDRFKTDCETLD